MIWHYNLRILFEEVCKFPFSLILAREKDSKNILERLVYEEKYKIMYYTTVDAVAYQGWSNCSFLLNGDLGVLNGRWNFEIRNSVVTPINTDLFIELWETLSQSQIEKEV